MSERSYYIIIDGEKCAVSFKVYKAYQKFENKMKYSEKRRHLPRVTIDGESGKITVRNSPEISLEHLMSKEIQFPDTQSPGVESYIENKIILEDAIEQLEDDEKEFIDLHYFQGFSIPALSEMFEYFPVKTYRKRNKILCKLNKILSE